MKRYPSGRVLLPALVAISGFAHCAHAGPVTGSIMPRLACSGPESALVGALVYERDRGTPKEEMVRRASALSENDGTQLIALSRIDDVYLDDRLTAATISAYRATRCQGNFLLRDYRSFETVMRERLLQCQALGLPGDRKFRSCVHDLLEHMEEQLIEADEQQE